MAEVVNVPKLGPSQSTLAREKSSLDSAPTEKKSIEPVKLSGTVVVKRPSFLSRLKDTFIAEDARDVGDYILWDILVPTVKRTIRDIIVGSADRVFLGASSPSSNVYRDRGVTYVRRTDYSSASTRTTTRPAGQESRALPPQTQRTGRFKSSDVRFDIRGDAENVMNAIVEYFDAYPALSVDEFYEIADAGTAPYTMQNYGWKADVVSRMQVEGNLHDGYFVRMPTPGLIK